MTTDTIPEGIVVALLLSCGVALLAIAGLALFVRRTLSKVEKIGTSAVWLFAFVIWIIGFISYLSEHWAVVRIS